jgi:hypothetical protein
MQERVGETLENICIGNDFLNRTQMAWQLREMIDKLNYRKWSQTEEAANRMGENLCQLYI